MIDKIKPLYTRPADLVKRWDGKDLQSCKAMVILTVTDKGEPCLETSHIDDTELSLMKCFLDAFLMNRLIQGQERVE